MFGRWLASIGQGPGDNFRKVLSCHDSPGGNTSHLSPEVHSDIRHHSYCTAAGTPVCYAKQSVFDTALCMYSLITVDEEAIPGYPDSVKLVSKMVEYDVDSVVLGSASPIPRCVTVDSLDEAGYPPCTLPLLLSMLHCNPYARPSIHEASSEWRSAVAADEGSVCAKLRVHS